MQIYNSLTKTVEKFKPIEDNKIIMYVCGLTPYDDAHLGHARTYLSFDMMKRYFIKKGFRIYHIQNITDVEDKIINRAKESKRNPLELSEEFQKKADVIFDKLNILKADVYPKASEHIKEIVDMTKKILENKSGYESKDGVYFEVLKFKGYGKLSGQKLDSIKKGARIEINENKKNAEDFVLWKKEEDEIIGFDSPFGKGRPGWHIECSAMSMKYSKERTLDIHGGGKDLSFPHHENEIAQTESALGIPFVNYWVHTGFLTVNGEKMSKSLGNFIIIEDVLKEHTPNSIRLFFAHTHYRSPIDYSEKEMRAEEKTVERIFETYNKIEECESNDNGDKKKHFEKEINEFYKHMDHDFDTPQALASFFSLIKKINISIEESGFDKQALEYLRKEYKDILWILGLKENKKQIEKSKLVELFDYVRYKHQIKIAISKNSSPDEIIQQLIGIREWLREKKNYQGADEIRSKLREIGIILEDKKEGKTKYKIV